MVLGFQVGCIYELGNRFMVCTMMDFQKMECQFKIFETINEAREFCR
jgi:hypothetical protein